MIASSQSISFFLAVLGNTTYLIPNEVIWDFVCDTTVMLPEAEVWQ